MTTTSPHKPVVVNLWAPPGVGKSTLMSGMFHLLKLRRKQRVEMVTEFAKDLTYEKNAVALSDVFYTMAVQEHRVYRLRDQVDIIITDSPQALAVAYCEAATEMLAAATTAMVMRNRYRNYDVWLGRNPKLPYQTYGRNQSEAQSKALEERLKSVYDEIESDGLKIEVQAGELATVQVIHWLEREGAIIR